MTHRLHVIDYYMDGYQPVSFCKVCSAEGDKLFEECPGKYEKPLDASNQTANKGLLKTED